MLRCTSRPCAASGMLRHAIVCAMTAALLLVPAFWPLTDGSFLTSAKTGGTALAKSAFSPRNSGLEPPGGPKPMEGLPGKNVSRTADGGMGYTDAYGNTIDDRQPEEKPARQRTHPGAYGPGAGQSDRYERPLPNPQNQTPAWSFK